MTIQTIGQRLTRSTRAGNAALRRHALGLLAGLLGSLAAVVVMLVLRLTAGTLTPPELLGERILPHLTTGQFIQLLVTFAPHSKTAPLGLTLLGQVAIGILLGPLYELLARVPERPMDFLPGRREWIAAGGLVLTMVLVALPVFWPVLDEGLYGDPLDRARVLTIGSLLLTFGAFGAVTALADHALRRVYAGWTVGALARGDVAGTTLSGGEATAVAHVSRRAALATAGATVLAVGAGVYAVDRLLVAYLARSNLAYEGGGTPSPVAPITPADEFYVVSKNVLDPTVLVDRWQMELRGHVRTARTWSYDALRRLPSETRAITLECISNGPGGHLISTAEWQGVTLRALLDEAGGVTEGGKYVIFSSVDGYTTSLPLADLLEARTLLAWNMNGAPLPDRHGFPLRAVVPGRFGEQSAKWLTRIEMSDIPYKGFYQSQGWSDGPVETTSRIDLPSRMLPLGPITLGGIAFAGIRGIRQVEVSADGGSTWHEATLAPALSDQTWVLWSWTWRPQAAGTYTLVVRATDGTGVTQTPVERGTVPDGATGRHRVKVQVR